MFDDREKIKKIVHNKNVLFITYKDVGYIRNSQEINLIKESCRELKILSANAKLTWSRYFLGIIKIFLHLFFLRKKKYNVVFLGYLPQFSLSLPTFLFRNKIIVIDFFISLYDTLVNDRKIFSQNSIVAKLAKYLDIKTLKKADYAVIDSRADENFFIKEIGLDRNKSIIIYLEADKSIYFPHRVEKPKELMNKFIVLYFGTIIPSQGIEIICRTAKILEKQKGIFFIIIGPVKNYLLKEYSSLNNTLFIPWLDQKKLSDYIAMSDLCLAGHFNGTIEKAKRVIPGKAYIFQSMKMPMILGDNPANREVFSEKDKNIYFVKMGDEKELANKIKEIFEKKPIPQI
jgi:glycosyltransferase involved in cell wall biosynthesis